MKQNHGQQNEIILNMEKNEDKSLQEEIKKLIE